MLYRYGHIASYKSSQQIEEIGGMAIVKFGQERKKISLHQTEVKEIFEGDIVKVKDKIALVLLSKMSSNEFLILIGREKKEMSLFKDEFVPYSPEYKPSHVPSIPIPKEGSSTPISRKKQRQEQAKNLSEKYLIDINLAFSIIDRKISIDKALQRRTKRQLQELYLLGVAGDIIRRFEEEEITYQEALELHQIRLGNPDFIYTEDIYDKGSRLRGSGFSKN